MTDYKNDVASVEALSKKKICDFSEKKVRNVWKLVIPIKSDNVQSKKTINVVKDAK